METLVLCLGVAFAGFAVLDTVSRWKAKKKAKELETLANSGKDIPDSKD